MTNRILILTQAGDVHAYAVSEALRLKGAEVVLWHTSDFPSVCSETIEIDGQGMRLLVRGPDLQIVEPGFHSVWHRRPTVTIPEDILHPADRQFALTECRSFQRGVFDVVAPDAFWVNPADAALRASRKLLQLRTASNLGLQVPETILTNDPNEIRAFIDRQGGTVVWKAFGAVPWQDEETFWVPFTSLLTREQLVEDDLLRAVPGIYQAVGVKAFELRVTVIGRRVLAAKILSQETAGGRLDWRKAYGELMMEPFQLRTDIANLCVEMLARLGLVFGCFDFIVTPKEEYLFLEVNEMGQFLFVEHYSGLPLLDAFSELLLQGRVDFTWDPDQPRVRYRDLVDRAREFAARAASVHAPVPEGAAWEGKKPKGSSSKPRDRRR